MGSFRPVEQNLPIFPVTHHLTLPKLTFMRKWHHSAAPRTKKEIVSIGGAQSRYGQLGSVLGTRVCVRADFLSSLPCLQYRITAPTHRAMEG